MKTLFYSQLDEPTYEKLKKDFEIHRPERVVLFCETEWESRELNDDLANLFNKHNVHLVVTFGSYNHEFYNKYRKIFNSIEVVNWPTYWINWALMCSSLLDFNKEYKNFKYPFICLNNKNHSHRCAIVDELTGLDLLNKGIVTWHRFPNQTPSNHRYTFKYYDDSIRLIGDDFVTKLDSFLIPPEYHESFLHVVGEATINVSIISEKTCLPILFKKPWVVMADQYFHQKLIDLGFELYDEIIDYSFDSEPDLTVRANLIAQNVKRISEQNLNDLYKLIEPKAIRNYNRYMAIVKSAKHVPPIIVERAKLVKAGCDDTTSTDHRYVHICNMAYINL